MSPLKVGSREIVSVKIGSRDVIRIMHGSREVWVAEDGDGPEAYRYLRITCTAKNGDNDNRIAITEIEYRSTVGGADETGSGTASASATSFGLVPSRAFDNNLTNQWLSGNGLPQWIKYDFGEGNAIAVAQYAITAAPDTGFAWRSLVDFVLEGSNDDVSWTVIDQRTGESDWTQAEQRVFTL